MSRKLSGWTLVAFRKAMAQASLASTVPITQILYVDIPPSSDLGNISTELGQIWAKLLDSIASSPGFVRLYWGRRLEEPEKVQLHIGMRPSVELRLCKLLVKD